MPIKTDLITGIWIFLCTCTYIHNLSLQPFSQDYDLVYHTTYSVCINFIRDWWDLQFNGDSERQIYEMLFMANLFTLLMSDPGFELVPYV